MSKNDSGDSFRKLADALETAAIDILVYKMSDGLIEAMRDIASEDEIIRRCRIPVYEGIIRRIEAEMNNISKEEGGIKVDE